MVNVKRSPGRTETEPEPQPELHTQPRSSSLANPSEQEALELDINTANDYPPVNATGNHPSKFSRFWHRHVSMAVPHVDCRDHLANERTFLGYLRTGQAFAILGVIIAQLMRLQHNSTPNLTLGYFVVSVPLSSICHVAAMVMAILGAVRFLRVQNSMARGYAVAGGWEIKVAGTMATLVLLSMFILTLSIAIDKG